MICYDRITAQIPGIVQYRGDCRRERPLRAEAGGRGESECGGAAVGADF